MMNEEVREVLQEQIDKYGQEYDDRVIEALKTAIKALEQQTSGDCVSRNTLKRAVSELTYWHPTTDGRLEVGGAFDNTVYKVEDVWRLTRELPSVTPEPYKAESEDDNIYDSGYNCGYADAMNDDVSM